MALARIGSAVDFLVRLAFFAAAPFLLVFAAQLFPVTGAIVQIALGLAAFFAGEPLQRVAAKSKLAASLLSSQLEFEAYYKAHPPRPFVYYVFYPLLAPYWLFVREAREEFLLYKGYTLASFALLLASQIWGYLRSFPAELGFAAFWPLALGAFVAESIVVLMFMMPMVTSVVHFHTRHAPVRLAVLLVAAAVSMTAAFARVESRRDPLVSFATRQRLSLRTEAEPGRAEKAQQEGLRAAWRELSKERDDVALDGKVQGEVLEAAQAALTAFYRPDEANAFDLWYVKRGRASLLVLYFEARRKRAPIWLAMKPAGEVTHDVHQLPRDAYSAMWRLTR